MLLTRLELQKLSFASTVSEIDFELTDLTVQDATPMPVTSGTPM